MRRGAARPRRRYPSSVAALTTSLALAAVASGMVVPASAGRDVPPWVVVVLVAVLVMAGLLHVDVRHGDEVDAIDLFEAALAPAVFVLPGLPAVALAVVGKGLAEGLLGVAPVKAAFNVAQWGAAAATGGLVVTALSPGPERGADALPALVVAMAAVAAVNHVAFVTVLRLAERRPLGDILRDLRPVMVRGWLVGNAVNLVIGLLFAAAFASAPATVALFPAVLGVLHAASRGYAATLADRTRLRALQRATHVLAGPVEPHQALPAFLSEVRACFEAGTVDLLVAEEGEQTLHRVGRDDGYTETAGGAEDVAAIVLARGGTVVARADGPDPAVAAVLAGEGREEVVATPVATSGGVTGALCVYDRQGIRGGDEAALAVCQALAVEVGQALDRQRLLTALKESEARFRVIVQRSADVVTVVDAHGVLRYASPAVREVLGLVEDDVVGQRLLDLVHPDDVALVGEALERCRAASGASVSVTHRARAAGGTWRVLDSVATNLLEDRWIAGLVLHSRDATARTRAESLLAGQVEALGAIARDRPLREILRLVAGVVEAHSGARGAAVVVDGATRVVVGPAPDIPESVLRELARHHAASPAGPQRPLPFVDRDVDDDPALASITAAEATPVRSVWAVPVSLEGDLVGAVLAYHDRPRGAATADRRALELAAQLVRIAVERRRSRARLVAQATRDPLTGLPNRTLFLDRTRLALSRARRASTMVGVLFVDLDGFKMVNDSLGHDAGDQVLIALSHRLAAAMRPADTVARFGGDEFTILCEGLADEADSLAVAERVGQALAPPLAVGGRELFISASIGVALADGDDVAPATLLENADAAMYQAKERGGRRVEVFREHMRTTSQHRLATRNALHRAVERGELRVLYQPVVSLATGELVGAEALVRWDHPGRGLLGADEFIGTAEETGLIVPIGAHVLREACRQAASWRAAGRGDLVINVNLSARQFADPGLIDLVAETLHQSGADPAAITLEITESTLMGDAPGTAPALHALKEVGVRLAVDDFGTGYSSLRYLSRFPIDGLKVDRSFVHGLGADDRDTAIVAAVIHLARSLGLDAVAEGVETAAQLACLRELGCEVAQGFYFSPPVPAQTVRLHGAPWGG